MNVFDACLLFFFNFLRHFCSCPQLVRLLVATFLHLYLFLRLLEIFLIEYCLF